MNPYVIVTDSSCDLPQSVIAEYGLEVVQLSVSLDGGTPTPNNELDIKDFYAKLRAKARATTSAVNPDAFAGVFEKYLSQGTDVLYLGFSSGLSSTFNTGFVAAREMREKYPDRKCMAVDTLCASLGQGLIVVLAAEKKEQGAILEEVANYVEYIKSNLTHLFTVDDLFFLKRGGRVSALTAVAGSALGIKPVLHVDNEGHLIKLGTKRGRVNALNDLCERMHQLAIDPAEQSVFISHGDCEEDANYLAEKIKETMGVKKPILVSHVGPVIGAHSGPGTVALFFLGKER